MQVKPKRTIQPKNFLIILKNLLHGIKTASKKQFKKQQKQQAF